MPNDTLPGVRSSDRASREPSRNEINALHEELVDAQVHRTVVRFRVFLTTSLMIGLLVAVPMAVAGRLDGPFGFIAAVVVFGALAWLMLQLISQFRRWQAQVDEAKEQVEALQGRVAAARGERHQGPRHEG